MTKEQYLERLEQLERLEFYANMSDDYSVTCRELREIDEKRRELNRRAKEEGII